MKVKYFSAVIKLLAVSYLVSGCQGMGIAIDKNNPLSFLRSDHYKTISTDAKKNTKGNFTGNNTQELGDLLDGTLSAENDGSDFLAVLRSALHKDPVVIAKQRAVQAKLAAVASSEAKKNYQISSTIYGGVEDITDNTKGVAVDLSASRLLFDGGLLDAQIAAKSLEADAAKFELRSTFDERGYRLAEIWLDLEKYKALQSQIDQRLSVLDPLIVQLEQVAKAGIGDVSKVTAAQMTVTSIRVTQNNIREGLAKAELEFLSEYGMVNKKISYDDTLINSLIPDEIDELLIQKSPKLKGAYARYEAANKNVLALEAKDGFNVGFEARARRPFAGSSHDSDESVGLVAKKTLFNGGMFESEVVEAKARAAEAMAQVQAIYRESSRAIKAAQQSIDSMDKAIVLARENARAASEEIDYLRQQLIIGGSTLDSVLSAEARLYEAVSKEINFTAERRRAGL